MKIRFLWVGLLVSLVATLYCFFAILMVGSLAAGPTYPKARFEYNFSIWRTATLIFLAIDVVFGIFLIMNYKKRNH